MLLRWLWTLPTNLLGHAAGLLVSGRIPRRVGGPAAVGWLYPIRAGLGLDWVGAVTLAQLVKRPVISPTPYRTPVPGLYLCSSSTPPGGGVHGMCGYHAAKRALKDVFDIEVKSK